MSTWDALQGIGAAVGVVTAAFVIWERVYRDQPSFFITSKPIVPGGTRDSCYLTIKNHSERPMVLTFQRGQEPNMLTIARDHSLTEMAKTFDNGQSSFILDGKDEVQLPVLTPVNWQDLDLTQTAEHVVLWRFVQPLIWKHDRSFRISITKRDYLLMQREAVEDQ